MAVTRERRISMAKAREKLYFAVLVVFVLAEGISFFYLPGLEYFFLLWTFISLIGVIMVFKREKWWLRFRPMRFAGQHTPEPEVKEGPDVDYMTAREQGMDVEEEEDPRRKNPFVVPRKPKAVRLGMLSVFVINIIGLTAVMIYLY
jgi:hypothetical protein